MLAKPATAVLVALLFSCAAAEEAKIRLEAAPDTRGKNHVFVVKGSGGLQDGESVDVSLFYVRLYRIPEGLREAGGPEFDEELVDLDKGVATVSGGSFEAVLCFCDLDPWPGLYRAVAKSGDIEEHIDIKVGKAEDLAALRARVDRDIYEELARIHVLYDGLRERWNRLGADPDPTWKEFRSKADAVIGHIRERNARRRKADIYWMESRGKQRVQLLLQALVPLLDAGGLRLGQPKDKRPPAGDFDKDLAVFEEDYLHYLDFLGIGRIIDAGKVSAALARLQAIEKELAGWKAALPAKAAEWPDADLDLGTRILQAQMDLGAELPEAYFARAEAVSKSLLRVLDHVRAVAGGKTPAKDWDAIEKEFKAAVNTLDASVPRIEEE